MMYPFMTLDDGTEIVHSETLDDGRVKVYIEKPDARDCFHHATCMLPEYQWEDIYGFSEQEMNRYREMSRGYRKTKLPYPEMRPNTTG